MSNDRKTITGYELKNGMRILNQHIKFLVSNVTIKYKAGNHGEDIVRWTGTIEEKESPLFYSAYNGGTYGKNANLEYTLAEDR